MPLPAVERGHCRVVLVWVLAGLVSAAREGFGHRLVPRFETPLSQRPNTWFTGRVLLRRLSALERWVARAGERSMWAHVAGQLV